MSKEDQHADRPVIGPERGRYRQRVTQLAADAAAAERAGFSSVWVSQVPGEFDAFTTITLMGQATERIELGTAVQPIQTRHPIAMAQEELAILERLHAFRDARATDVTFRVLALGSDRESRIESKKRTLEFLGSLAPEL